MLLVIPASRPPPKRTSRTSAPATRVAEAGRGTAPSADGCAAV